MNRNRRRSLASAGMVSGAIGRIFDDDNARGPFIRKVSRPYGTRAVAANPLILLMHLTRELRLPTLAAEVEPDQTALRAISLLSSGGDSRITLDPETGLNKYLSGPYPRTTLAYASSTANDMSLAAFAHVAGLAAGGSGDDEARLDRLRARLRAAYRLPDDCAVV